VQRDGGQPVIQVFAEAAGAHVVLQVAVGRGDDAHVHRHRPVAAERPELALLQHAQQLDLEGRAGFADFVEEQRAAIGLLEQADAVVDRAGEGAALVAEQLGFEQRVGQAPQFSVTKALLARRLS
jgi:hypothetical protein